MISKKVLVADRIRRIEGGFSFIPHRFLTDGFLKALSQQELLLYIFLVMAADRFQIPFELNEPCRWTGIIIGAVTIESISALS